MKYTNVAQPHSTFSEDLKLNLHPLQTDTHPYDMANLIKIKKATVKSWPAKLKPTLIARGEGNPYEETVTKLMGELPDLVATVSIALDEDQTPRGAHYKLLGRPIQLAVKAKAIWNEGPKDARVVFTFDPENIEFPSIGDQRGLTQWVDVFDSG